MLLSKEAEYYRRRRWQWIAQGKEGLYVAVHDREVGGFYSSASAALIAGVRRWAPSLFLVRQVTMDRSNDPFDLIPGTMPGANDALLAG